MPLTEDRWLSERFGHPVFTVRPGDDPRAAATEAAERAAGGGPVTLQARIPSEREDAVTALTEAGFGVVNVAVALARGPGEADPGPGGFEVRDADPARDRAVLDIAQRSFTKTRFHLDPRIPREVADRVKRDWAENSLEGRRGDGMLVAVRDGRPVGFLAGLTVEDGESRVRVIDLIAVDEAARGEGAGHALTARLIAGASDCDEVRVGTQEANPRATAFYERLGFERAGSSVDLHLHAGDVWPGAAG